MSDLVDFLPDHAVGRASTVHRDPETQRILDLAAANPGKWVRVACDDKPETIRNRSKYLRYKASGLLTDVAQRQGDIFVRAAS